MYKVEREFVCFDENNRIEYHCQRYFYFDTLEDALKCVVDKMTKFCAVDKVICLYIWQDDNMIFHAECNDGVWS